MTFVMKLHKKVTNLLSEKYFSNIHENVMQLGEFDCIQKI